MKAPSCPWGPCNAATFRRCARSGVDSFDPTDDDNCGADVCSVDTLSCVGHERTCKWYDDQDWGSSTFANYVNAYNAYPPCTCTPPKVA